MGSIDRREILEPGRVRAIPPEGFGWIEQRLLRNGWLGRLSPQASTLYLFLCLVADRWGLSWWSDRRSCQTLAMPRDVLLDARQELLAADLVAFRPPVYQVLTVPGALPLEPRTGQSQPVGIAAVLDELFRRSPHGSSALGRDPQAP